MVKGLNSAALFSFTEDERDFFLTINGVKPSAAVVCFSRPFLRNEERLKAEKVLVEKLMLEEEICFEYRHTPTFNGLVYHVALDETRLRALSEAKRNKDERAMGIALGYPLDAVQAYTGKPTEKVFALEKGIIKRGIDFPAWLPYLDHIPAVVDAENITISPSSLEQAERYRQFIEKTNMELAMRLNQSVTHRVYSLRDRLIPSR